MRKPKKKKITINDIAIESGVSKATVSYVLNKKQCVSKNTEERILKVINKYGFKQSFFATNISQNKQTNIIALILGREQYKFLPYFSTFISNAIQQAKKYNKNIITLFAESDERILDILINNTAPIDGAIIDMFPIPPKIKDALGKTNIPLVLIGRPDFKLNKNASYCDADNEACTYKLTKAIFKKGYKNPTLFNVSRSGPISDDRKKGFLKACNENNIKGNVVVLDALQENFYNETKKVLEKGCDSIITESTFFVEGSYKAIKEKGLKIGKDIGICALGYSFDKKSDHNPHITYAEQNWKEMSIKSVDLLCRILNHSRNKRHCIVKSKIHYQQSLTK